MWGPVAHIALRAASLRLEDVHQPDAGARPFGNADGTPERVVTGRWAVRRRQIGSVGDAPPSAEEVRVGPCRG
ncbi:hypothetical protein GTW68_08285 [Streptomyces sp. SID4945]|nr:hypothetical protein [Streptomyces sp. SID4945]